MVEQVAPFFFCFLRDSVVLAAKTSVTSTFTRRERLFLASEANKQSLIPSLLINEQIWTGRRGVGREEKRIKTSTRPPNLFGRYQWDELDTFHIKNSKKKIKKKKKEKKMGGGSDRNQ